MATNLTPNELALNHDPSSSPTNLQMSTSQLSEILESIQRTRPVEEGSFAKCSGRFDGIQCYAKVVEFITTTSIYKDIEHISDENAPRGLPLLLQGHAATWWRGVQTTVRTWREAVDLIRATFVPRRPAYQVYTEVFRTAQDPKVPTDLFISKKRALLAELPELPTESVQIDMLYGLLRFHLRERISGESITSFTDLVNRAREIEKLEKEAQQQNLEERPVKKDQR
uniref:activity-regulated cytoskeleton associated protein 2-like n=1 Tax=Osmia lignaria TaxID=473952 RepID=UPI001478F10B|nr:activity-regulated cytoskeleton associated protein 2-like [Osmia lignaria]